jgi:hypothetical protein
MTVTGITDLIGADSIYEGDERVGATLRRRAHDERNFLGREPTAVRPTLTYLSYQWSRFHRAPPAFARRASG